MTHQILICSYPPDYPWLINCLLSLKKFCRGFLPPVVCVDRCDEDSAKDIVARSYPEATVAVYPLVHGMSGFMRAQCGMLHGDVLCPGADIIWLVGSDCLAFAEFRPDPFMWEGKPVMLYNTYEHLLQYHPQVMPWKVGTERILGLPSVWETMRRLPLLYPRKLFGQVRGHVERVHGRPFTEYIFTENAKHHNTSESNILGSFAHHLWINGLADYYHWHNMDENYGESVKRWPSPMIQFWSHHPKGLDGEVDCRFDYPGGNTFGRTARAIINEVLQYVSPP